MGNTGRTVDTVKVHVHRLVDGRTMVAILGSRWAGPVRLDVRYTSARPLAWSRPAPDGVNDAVWQAYVGLGELVAEQHAKRLAEDL